MDRLKRLNAELDRELARSYKLIFSCTAIALKRTYHWERNGIRKFLDLSDEVWRECASTNEKSMIQMLDHETGVEIQTGDGKSWEELAFLNAGLSKGELTRPQIIYMKGRMKKWIAPQVRALALLALYRKCGLEAEEIAKIHQRIQEVERELRFSAEAAAVLCEKETGVDIGGRK